MRSIPFYPMMVLVLVGLGGYLGCDPNSVQLPPDAGLKPTASTTTQYSSTAPSRSQNRLLLGSFNLQRLGPKKLGDAWVMERLAAVLQQFDVVALQEITSKDQRTLPLLVEQVNRSGAKYEYVISERMGRPSGGGYYEQYAYVYDSARVRSGKDYCYTVNDDRDVLHREPFVGRFQTISDSPFGFTLINMHTDPDEIKYELDVLADVFVNVRQYEFPEDDVILLGDLNAAPGKLQRLGQIDGFIPLIEGIATNTRMNRTLDNIMIDGRSTREFTGRAGTISLEQMFDIELGDAERLSDHLPIWAEFSMDEVSASIGATASGTPPTLR